MLKSGAWSCYKKAITYNIQNKQYTGQVLSCRVPAVRLAVDLQWW